MICMKLFEFSGYYNQIKQCVKFIKFHEDSREYAGGIFYLHMHLQKTENVSIERSCIELRYCSA
jgi:hypothetical protein